MQQRATGGAQPAVDQDAFPGAHTISQQPMTAFFSWTPLGVILLTSAMVSPMLVTVYGIDRTAVLALQYFIWAIATYLILTAVPRRDPRFPEMPSRMSRFFFLFLVAFSLSTVAVWINGNRSDLNAMLAQSAALLFMALPFFAMERASRTVRIDRAVLWTCHITLGLGLYSILGDFLGLAHFESFGGRYFGSLGDSIAWALTLPLIVYFSTGRMPLAALAGVGLALTASRAPVLISVGALILLMFFSRGRRFHYAAMILALSIVGLFQGELYTTLADRFATTTFTSNDRTTTAALGIKIFLQSPLFGSGYNSLTHFYPTSAHRMSLGILPSQTSTAVQMLSDGGVITFLAYFCFVVAATIAGIGLMRNSQRQAEGGLINGIAAWLLAMLWLNQSALWFVVGSYVGPLVLGMAGVIAGSRTRFQSAQALAAPPRRSRPALG
jgi:hypothetical protein